MNFTSISDVIAHLARAGKLSSASASKMKSLCQMGAAGAVAGHLTKHFGLRAVNVRQAPRFVGDSIWSDKSQYTLAA